MCINIKTLEADSKVIKRKKSSVAKAFSLTRSKSIEVANELTVILFALNRYDESLFLLKSYSEKSPFDVARNERWHAACFAMLLQSHIERIQGNITESQRLLVKVNNDHFNPSNWFTENELDDFLHSIDKGVDELDGVTKAEKLQVRAEGVLMLLVANYLWTAKWSSFSRRVSDIEYALNLELGKIRAFV